MLGKKIIIRVGIIGAGNIAREHLKAFSSIPNVKIVGIFSRTNSKAEILSNDFNIQYVVKSVNDLFSLKIDLVIIAVSAVSIFKVCLQVFKYKWTVLVEKPLGINFRESNYLFNVALKNKINVYLALNRRYFKSTKDAIGILSKAKEKRVIIINGQEDPRLQLKDGVDPKIVKNLFFANSIHIIDYFLIFGRGEINRVEPIIKYKKTTNFFSYKISFTSGDIGIYNCFIDVPGLWSVNITTNKIRLVMQPLETLQIQKYGSRKLVLLSKNCSNDIDFKPGFYKQAEEIIRALNGKTNNALSINEAMKTIVLIKKFYEK